MPTAKIEIDFPMSKRLGSFLDDIKGFASDPAHEADRDVIADFVDKVLVVEMKRYMAKDEFRKVSVDIPQDVLMEPLKNARKLVEGLFRNLTGEQLASDPAPEEIEKAVTPRKDTLADIEADINGVPAPAASPVAPIVNQKRSGNGHVAAKKRDLDSTEKDRGPAGVPQPQRPDSTGCLSPDAQAVRVRGHHLPGDGLRDVPASSGSYGQVTGHGSAGL